MRRFVRIHGARFRVRRAGLQGVNQVLSVQGLDAGYDSTRVLFGVSFRVGPGELVCVMGRNGAGKTTLLNSIMGVLPMAAGTVRFEGRDVTGLKSYERVRLGMGYVPQGHDTFPQLSVLGNLLVTLEASPHRDPGAIDEVLEVFPRLKPMLKRRAGFLAGGQRQQLAMARALITRPKLLILDEPTEGIQPSIIVEIEEAIERLHTAGLAVLLVEQYLDLALRLADRFLILDAGHVVRSGVSDELSGEEVHRLLAV
ncbi:MAG TPA: urea ABC transporter ATP-binding subunit UrtE [Thermopolyspora sp.]